MTTHADKIHENIGKAVTNTITQKKSGTVSTFELKDNRPETIQMKKLQSYLMDNKKQNMVGTDNTVAQMKWMDKGRFNAPYGADIAWQNIKTNQGGSKPRKQKIEGFVTGGEPYLHSRGHLIGDQFGGKATKDNLVNLTQPCNREAMNRIEENIAAHAEKNPTETLSLYVHSNFDGSKEIIRKGVTVMDGLTSPVSLDITYENLGTGTMIKQENVKNEYNDAKWTTTKDKIKLRAHEAVNK